MAEVSKGDTVRVHYTGRLDDGTVFDSSEGRDPLEFKVGVGQVIAGFDNAVEGLAEGDTTTAKVPADEAYGPHREEMVLEVDRTQFPDDVEPEVGQRFELRREDGAPVPVTVVETNDDKVTLDANHPLAGKDLTFDIEVVEVIDA